MGKTFSTFQLILLSSTLILTGCTRSGSNTTIKVQFPAGTSSMQSASKKVSAQSEEGWGVADPAEKTDISCYAIFVGNSGADDKTCTTGTGSSFQKFTFKELKGLVPAGSSAEITVQSGPDRKFYVLGMRSENGCEEMAADGKINQVNYSTPLLLGTAQKSLSGGDESVTIPINLAGDLETQKMRSCNFYPTGSPSQINLRGPISSHNSTSYIGNGLCNKIYGSVRAGNDRPYVSENDYDINLSGTAGVQIFSDPACTTIATKVTVPKGKEESPFYVMSSSNGAATLTAQVAAGVLTSSSPSLSQTFNVDTASPTTATRIEFYQDRALQYAGSCATYDFFAVDSMNRSAAAGTMTPKLLDLDGGDRTSTLSTGTTGFAAFRDSCPGSTNISGSQNYGTGVSFGEIHFKAGALIAGTVMKDYQLGFQSTASGSIKINVTPTIKTLSLTGNTTPYASECSPITVTGINASNVTETFTTPANDFSPWTLARRAVVNFYKMSGGSEVGYYSGCAAPDYNSNVTLSSGTTAYSRYYVYGTTGVSYQFRAWAGSFASGQNDTTISVNPKWDPSLLPGSIIFWGRSEEAASSTLWSGRNSLISVPPFTHSSSQNLNLFSGSPSAALDSSLTGPTGTKSVNFFDVTGQGIGAGSLAIGQFYLAALIRVDDVNNGMNIFTFKDSTGPLSTYFYRMSNTDFRLNGYDMPGVSTNWQFVAIRRDGSNNLEGSLSPGVWTSAGSPTNTYDYFYVGSDASANSFTGRVAEVLLLNAIPSASDEAAIYNYFKTKFPGAALP